MRASLIAAVFAGFLFEATPAHAGAPADDPDPATDAMRDYFAGEKRGGWLLIAMGVAGLGAGGILITRSSPTAKGLSYPLLGVGLIHVVAGIFVNVASGRRVDAFEDRIAREPAAWVDDEHKRIQGVKRQFTALKIAELVLIAGGATMTVVGRTTDRPRLAGAGIGLALEAAATLAFDIIAARRAATYSDRLGTLQLAFIEPTTDDAPIPGLAYRLDF